MLYKKYDSQAPKDDYYVKISDEMRSHWKE